MQNSWPCWMTARNKLSMCKDLEDQAKNDRNVFSEVFLFPKMKIQLKGKIEAYCGNSSWITGCVWHHEIAVTEMPAVVGEVLGLVCELQMALFWRGQCLWGQPKIVLFPHSGNFWLTACRLSLSCTTSVPNMFLLKLCSVWLNLGNVCYHLVQNLLSTHLLSKNVKIKI